MLNNLSLQHFHYQFLNLIFFWAEGICKGALKLVGFSGAGEWNAP